MPPKAPAFWRDRNALSLALLPASLIYLAGHRIASMARQSYKSRLPVLCVGGVVAGGSGKTPTVHALLKLINRRGLFSRPVVVTRGYGGELAGPTLVDLEFHSAKDVGDEALLHATYVPTIVAHDRGAGARLAEAMDADLIILDDGLQNQSLEKDLSFAVIDSVSGIGNGLLIPAGPLREPLGEALRKCVAVVETNGKSGHDYGMPILSTATNIISQHDMNTTFHAFCGLGNPDKFFTMLDFHGFSLSGTTAFSDHHPYSARDLEELLNRASGARLITTEKDFVRVPDRFKDRVEVVSIELEFDDPDKVETFLIDGLK